MAQENGIVATRKDKIPRGARMPVRTHTAASGKRTNPNGISRQSKAKINVFSFQDRVVLDGCGVDVTMRFVSAIATWTSR